MPRSTARAAAAERAGILLSVSAAMAALAVLGWAMAPVPILP